MTTALRRLLRIRDLEEEQSQIALGSALGELKDLRIARSASLERARQGRELIADSARLGRNDDRYAGLIEGQAAETRRSRLEQRIVASEERTSLLRQEVLEKRVECRQAETLIDGSEARVAQEAARRDQRGLDDWFASRKFREHGE
jgi:flagellar biosynthesis chaperone FliJ